MPIIGSASVEIRAIDNLFERDVRDAVAKLKDVSIKISADVDLTAVRAKLDILRHEVEDNPINIKVNADTSEAATKLEELRTLYNGSNIDINTNVDTNAVDKALAGMNAGPQTRSSRIIANADTAAAETQLDFAARPREAKIGFKMNEDVTKGLKGAFYTLTGALPVDSIVSGLSEIAANFEGLAYKAATMATKVGSAGAELLTVGADAFTVAGDLTDAMGLFAAGPAVISSFAAIIGTTKIDWTNFGKAMSDNAKTAAKALKLLPPEAQAAAKEIHALKKEMDNAVQGAFWKEMGTSLQDMAKEIIPKLTNGLKGTSVVLADLTKGIIGTFAQAAKNGEMDTFFKNMDKGVKNATPGITAIATALNTLSAVGSKHLVTLGDYITKIGEKFDNWIQIAAKTGKIDTWINNAVTTVKELFSVVGSTVDVFKGLTAAADASGGKGLKNLADGLGNVAKTVNSEPFKGKFVSVLKDARVGAEALGDGFHKLFDQAGNASTGIGNFLKTTGQIGGSFLKDIGKIFDGTHFGAGLISFLDGIKYQVDNLGPAFHGVGDILGNLGDIAGTFFKADTGGINHLVKTISDVIANLKDGIVADMPIFNTFMQNLLQVISGPVTQIAKIIGNVMTIFAGLPGPIQTVIMAFATFFLLKDKFDAFSKGITTGFDKIKKAFETPDALKAPLGTTLDQLAKIKTGVEDAATSATKAPSAFKNMASQISSHFDGVRASFKTLVSAIGDGVSKTVEQMKPSLTAFATTFAAGIKNGLKEAFSSVSDMKLDFAQIKQDLTYVHDLAKYYFQKAGLYLQDALTSASAVGHKALDGIKASFSDIQDIARAYASEAKSMVGSVFSFIDERTSGLQGKIANIGTGVKGAAKDIVDGAKATIMQVSDAAMYVQQKATPALNAVSNMVKPVIDKIGSVSTTVGETISKGIANVQTVVSTVVEHTSNAMGKLGENFAPAKAAFSRLANDISFAMSASKLSIEGFASVSGTRISTFATETVTKISGMGSKLGSAMKTGLSSAASGLLGVLGGPWGIAVTAAIALMSAFGDAQAAQKQKVDDLAASLNQQTGAITDSAKTNIAKDWMDTGRNAFDNFWRGAHGNGRSSQEVADALNLDPKTVTDAISNPETRNAYASAWKDIAGSLNNSSFDLGGLGKITLGSFKDISDETLRLAGTSRDALSKMSTQELTNFANKINDTATATSKAQADTIALAKANGINGSSAALLSANYTTLADKTSSASDKFNALKSNLDILSKGEMSATDSAKAMHQGIDDAAAGLKNVAAEAGPAVTSLYTVGKGFDFTSQKGRDLHTTISTASDGILKLGTDALDRALKDGKSAGDAQSAALAAMAPGVASLEDSLKALHLSKPQIDGIIKSFGLMPKDTLKAIKLSVSGAEEADRKILMTKFLADAFAKGDFNAVLKALPQGAQDAITKTFHLGNAFAKGDYTAILKALNNAKGGAANALATILSVSDGNYVGKIEAADVTGPGVNIAKRHINAVTQADYTALIKAAHDPSHDPSIDAALDWLARTRTATITTSYINDPSHPAHAGQVVKPGQNGIGADGGIVPNMRNIFDSAFPLKAFANGGIENHVAQISQGQTPFRIWSEPETGGEAYIPLGANKRDRSLKILEQVAEMFGFGLTKAFANGGIVSNINKITSSPHTTGYSSTPSPRSGGINQEVTIYSTTPDSAESIAQKVSSELYWRFANQIS